MIQRRVLEIWKIHEEFKRYHMGDQDLFLILAFSYNQ